jgi:two-component system, sensor histidine kinase and response regulator
MQWTRKMSLRRKITYVIMINTFAALCAAGIAFAEYGVYRFKQMRLGDLSALASILGTNSAAPLEFKDPSAARDILQALAAKPHILSAVIYDREGAPFAVYHPGIPENRYLPPKLEPDSRRFTSQRVLIFQTIPFEGEKVGTVFLEEDTTEYKQLLERYLLFFGMIVAVVSLGAWVMADRLQAPISTPILELAWTAKMVTSSRDYSIRAGKRSDDEVGVLIDGFNTMLDQIQNRDIELRRAGEELERRVDERTLMLEQEVADRQRAQEALHESEGRIRLLLDSAAEAIFGVNREGRFTFCNPATLRILGYEKGDALLGGSAHALMHHTRVDGTLYAEQDCPIVVSRSDGKRIHLDTEVFWRADGTSFPVEYWAYPIRKEGEIVGAVVTFLDITERKSAEEALREAKEAAESANRSKSEFLANMSHEIRTPMNGIIGMTELALDTALTSEQREYLSLVRSSADGLLHVINDILDFSKIEAGKMELEETQFEIRDVLQDTLKTLAVRADKKNLELLAHVSPDVPRLLVGDPTRLRQLIVNLVGNSIKFTERGNVVAGVDVGETSGEGVHLHFRVSDTGIGIPLDKQQVIFESFAQADGSTTRQFGGTGLGLTISRRLVELMGGRMWVESEPGKGSTFHFTALFRPGAPDVSTEERLAGEMLPGLEILVADDNASNRKILAEMLTNWHMQPVMTAGGLEAMNAMEQASQAGRKFPIVLLDARMPEIDGFYLAEKIHANPGLAGSLILMLSAERRLTDTSRCRELGVNAFLTKPVGQSELLDAILSALGMEAAEESLIEAPVAVKVRPDGPSLRILVCEDHPVNQKLAVRLLEKAGHRMVLAGTGKQAVAAWMQSGNSGFDAILMDIQMPEMDGMEATIAIRKAEQGTGKHVPIIAMTANAMRGDKERYLEVGMDGYISKPIQSSSLFAEIDRCLHSREGGMAMTDNPGALPEQLTRAALLERVEGDQELLTEIINLFVDDAPRLMNAMRGAFEQRDMALLERLAHSMKGAAGNLCASLTAATAMQLEYDAKKGDAESCKSDLAKLEAAVAKLLPLLAELSQGVAK